MKLLTSIVTPDNVSSRWEDILQLFYENETLRNSQRSKGLCCQTQTGYSPMRSAEPRVAMKQCRSNLEAAFATAQELYKNAKVYCTVNGQERRLDYLCYRVQIALWVASTANGTCEEIVAALLLPLHQQIMLHERTFIKKLSEQRIEELAGASLRCFTEKLFPASTAVRKKEKMPDTIEPRFISESELDQIIFNVCSNNMFKRIQKTVARAGGDTSLPERAYLLACKHHDGCLDCTGIPSIFHPLGVAEVLANSQTDSEVIAAALLQNAPTLHEELLEQIDTELSPTIRSYTEVAEAISQRLSRHQFHMHPVNRGRDTHDSTTPPIDLNDLTRQLMETAQSQESLSVALCIAAADCIYQLRSLDFAASMNRHAATSLAYLLYLPLFRKYRMERLCLEIQDECQRLETPDTYSSIKTQYQKMLINNEWDIKQCQLAMENYICSFNNDSNYKRQFPSIRPYPFTVEAHPLLTVEIAEQPGNSSENGRNPVLTKQNTVLQKFFVILQAERNRNNILPFFRLFITNYFGSHSPAKSRAEKGEAGKIGPRGDHDIRYTIKNVSYSKDYNQHIIHLSDSYNNRFDIIIMSDKDYRIYQYGKDAPARPAASEEEENTITVYSPKHEAYTLPVGATALDFAYCIHNDLGLCAYDAIINNRHMPLCTVLKDGQTVHICRMPDESMKKPSSLSRQNSVVRASLEQFMFVVTYKAKRALVREFSRQLAGDDAHFEETVSNAAFHTHLRSTLDHIGSLECDKEVPV